MEMGFLLHGIHSNKCGISREIPLWSVCSRWLWLPVINLLLGVSVCLGSEGPGFGVRKGFRPPAVPLVVHDPYLSIWSFSDQLAADWPRHWTGRPHALASMIRVDGKAYRLMGLPIPDLSPMPQEELEVFPTRTIYRWRTAEVEVQLTLVTPALPQDVDVLARPVTYLLWHVRSVDGQTHLVDIYYDNSAELAVNEPSQMVCWQRGRAGSSCG